MESQAFNFSYCSDPKFKLSVLKKKTGEPCDICLLNEWKPVRYGEFIVKEYKSAGKLRCHYFCLLSGSCIPQRGGCFSGITGFLIKDIVDSFQEFRDKRCAYCCGRSAPIKCCSEGCKRWYHYACGYKNACLTQFFGQYNSFCHEHLPAEVSKPRETKNAECEICWELLPQVTDVEYNPVAIVQTCGVGECPPGLVHRECLQQYACSSGYNFLCPCCFSKEYKPYAERCGIFVPSRDSSWEREPGAFKDLHKKKCMSPDCKLVGARAGKNVSAMVGCNVCGGQLMHKICTNLEDPSEYLCTACMDETFIKLL